MKNVAILGCLVLFLASTVLLSCVTVKPITQADLPELKGKWKGFYQVQSGHYTQPVELEISDEKLNGIWTWNHANRPPDTFPAQGKIESGRIIYSWSSSQVNLNLSKGKTVMKLEGDYKFEQYPPGTISLEKVK